MHCCTPSLATLLLLRFILFGYNKALDVYQSFLCFHKCKHFRQRFLVAAGDWLSSLGTPVVYELYIRDHETCTSIFFTSPNALISNYLFRKNDIFSHKHKPVSKCTEKASPKKSKNIGARLKIVVIRAPGHSVFQALWNCEQCGCLLINQKENAICTCYIS